MNCLTEVIVDKILSYLDNKSKINFITAINMRNKYSNRFFRIIIQKKKLSQGDKYILKELLPYIDNCYISEYFEFMFENFSQYFNSKILLKNKDLIDNHKKSILDNIILNNKKKYSKKFYKNFGFEICEYEQKFKDDEYALYKFKHQYKLQKYNLEFDDWFF